MTLLQPSAVSATSSLHEYQVHFGGTTRLCVSFDIISHVTGGKQLTDPRAVVGLGLQLGHLGDLLEEVGLLHPRLGAAPLELRPWVRQDHLEVHRETWEPGIKRRRRRRRERRRGGGSE